MSSEYPPIIIDSSNFDEGTSFAQAELGSMMIRCDDFGAADPANATETVPMHSAIVSLYLIRDNRLIHQGEYQSEDVELIYGANPERTMAVGQGQLALGAGAGFESASDGRGRRVFRDKGRQVHTIRVAGRDEPLTFGRDYQNFILIVRRIAE